MPKLSPLAKGHWPPASFEKENSVNTQSNMIHAKFFVLSVLGYVFHHSHSCNSQTHLFYNVSYVNFITFSNDDMRSSKRHIIIFLLLISLLKCFSKSIFIIIIVGEIIISLGLSTHYSE